MSQDHADLDARMAFLIEADRLKSVIRATRNADGARHENTAEHSWHLTLFALTLAPHASEGVQIDRVIRMLILHDLVEIDAGDTPIFGETQGQAADEAVAADRIFGLLPADQAAEFRALWDEFEAAETPDAIFAKSLDRFQPPNLNLSNGGGSWTDYNVTEETVRIRVGTQIARGAPALWDWLSPRIAAFFAR
ncbi:HD domain-containing protein [Jannaschia pohangensis]|uniref:Putative hydrolases of HD superfamily n=1 Tax=Jannaschia pohangensis TaxID=390807 RepID=A0A1I3GCI9_9RHOB|nr:HD domain-containing protein [Jannaschia pohangensis]SFI21245.1 putative hydrolases of HD superfamily [Jannaschia pohangensis]